MNLIQTLRDLDPRQVELTLRNPRIIIPALIVAAVAPLPALALGWFLFSAQIKPVLADQFWLSIIVMAVGLFVIIHACAGLILLERKLASWFQDRIGPNRVGWWGLLQPIADGIKFLLKEDITPKNVDRPLFILAPGLAFVIAMLGFAVIPWGGKVTFPWMEPGTFVYVQAAQVDIGFLYILAVGSLSVYGVVLAGYASNNKYAFYGGMRATAQMLSYEVPLGLGLLALLLMSGTLRLDLIVDQQATTGWWNIITQPLAFVLVLVAAFAETNRTPFDLAECEQELIGGYHTEYSSMKFALFFLGEYAHMITASALLTALFLGGWHLPFLPGAQATDTSWWAMLIKVHVFAAKVGFILGVYMWVRWSIPRFRFDQLMRVAWKGLVPVGMLIVMMQAFLIAYGYRLDFTQGLLANSRVALLMFGLNTAIVVLAMVWMLVQPTAVTGRQDNMPPIESV